MLKLFARRKPAPAPVVAAPPPPPPAPEIAVLRSAADGILATDGGGRITLANPAATAVAGRDLLGGSLHELLHPAGECGEDCPVSATLRDGAPRRGTADMDWSLSGMPGGGVVAILREVAAAEPEPEAAPELVAAPGEVPLVRRAITDEHGNALGYELCVVAETGDTAQATAGLLLEVADEVRLDELTGTHRAWLTISAAFLRDVGTPPVRPDRAVLQLAAGAVTDDIRAVLGRLRFSGYEVALTGYAGDAGPLGLCHYVTVPVRGRTDDELRALVAEPAKRGVKLVATGVSTASELERCRALGFTLFQGEFLATPGLVRRRRVGSSDASLRTLAEVTAPGASFEDLDRTISADVGLSVKLLRYVNSAFFGLPRTVESVREALTLLGTATVRRWATVMALGSAGDAPGALIDLALQRARMCEILGGSTEYDSADALFTVGLFSVADALLGTSMDEVLESLPLSEEITAALLNHEGPKGELLDSVLAYERGEAEAGAAAALPGAYRESVAFAGEMSAGIGAAAA